MNFLHSIYDVLYYQIEPPKLFGKFHIIAFLLTIIATVIAVGLLGSVRETIFRRFLLGTWIILVILEVYRELVFSLSLQNGDFVWEYAWYQFPFQLCGTPLYVLPVVIFAKDGRVRSACLSFLAVWSLFGGLTVMFYPAEIFVSYIGICIQSYFHHAAQVLIGVVIAVRTARADRLDRRFFLGGTCVFLVLFGIAMLMNEAGHRFLVANAIDDSFNMFFISPYYPCTLPVLSEVQKVAPYPLFLLTYIAGFFIIAVIIFCIQRILTDKFVKKEV